MGASVNVLKATTAMLSYLTKETCTIDPQLRAFLAINVSDQFLLAKATDNSKYGLVTIHSDYEDGSDNDDIRMIADGRARFDETEGFDGWASVWNPVHGQSDMWLQANNKMGEFFSETNSTQSKFIILAPHGGAIEAYTDEIANRIYAGLMDEKDLALWYCIGYQSAIGAYDAWHVTSTRISTNSFQYLANFLGRSFDHALAIHGYGEGDVAVGGAAPLELKNEVKAALEGITGFPYAVNVVTTGEYAGTDPNNIVNRWSMNGVQIELPSGARNTWWQQIADALTSLYQTKI